MDGMPYSPFPTKLHAQVREIQHDLQRAKANLASGRLRPEQYAKLAGILDARIEALEAEVSIRLLDAARAPTRRVLGSN